MTCPDANRLIDHLSDPGSDRELRAHLKQCAVCSEGLRLLQEVQAAFRPTLVVPEYLVQRALTRIGAHPALTSSGRARHIATAAVLGVLTTAMAVLATGSTQGGGVLQIALFSLAAGGAVALHEARTLRRE